MSLLIDALKKAEDSRRRLEQGEIAAADAGLSLEALPTDPPPPRAATAAVHAEAATAEPAETQRAAMRELFEPQTPRPNRGPLVLALVALVLLVGGAAYVWWEIQPRTAVPLPMPLPVINPLPPAPPPEPPSPARGADEAPDTAPPARARTAPTSTSAENQAISIADGIETLRRSDGRNRTASEVQSAYAAYRAGRLDEAVRLYQQVLIRDPLNVDALDALGVLAQASGDRATAERYFRQALLADPRDAVALSQLADLLAEGDTNGAELRLRALLAEQPQAAAVHFALGGVYAREGRWREAQQAYFDAHTLQPENPDSLYNLAVSLEQLNQPRLAAGFYRQALEAAHVHPASFDAIRALTRLQTLESAPAPEPERSTR